MIKKIRKMDSDKIIYFLFSLMSILYLVSKLLNSEYSGLKIVFIGFFFIIMLVSSFFLLQKIPKKIENYFLLFSIIFGIFYILGFPPSQLPDDSSDYLRSLEVSQFQLTTPQHGKSVGRRLSSNIDKVYTSKTYNDVLKKFNLGFNKGKKFYVYANKSLYAFVCYIPQAIGVFIANFFGLSIFFQILLGKLCNYLLYVVLIYYSIKYIPIKKELIFFISLLPMSLQEAASLSPDAMIISTIIALFSFVLYQRENKNAFMSVRNKVLIAILAILISLCKIVYLPLIFLVFLIPDNKFKSKKEKMIYCFGICAVSAIFNLYWLSISSKYLVAFSNRSNSSLQLKYILSNPLSYCIILYRTIDKYALSYLQQLIGYSLGNFVIQTSEIMVIVSLVFMFLLIIGSNKKGKDLFKISEKIYVSILLVGTILLMFTSLYMQWTAYQEKFVDGVQGRYFIPLIPILSMIFMKEKEKNYEKKLVYIVFFIDVMSIIAIYKSFI